MNSNFAWYVFLFLCGGACMRILIWQAEESRRRRLFELEISQRLLSERELEERAKSEP
mgnify:CR=1 FL=1